MPDILTLTPNPAVDLSTSTPRVVPTDKLRCTLPSVDAGGGGINVARVVSRLGGEAVAAFAVGGSNGAQLRALVEAEGIAVLPVEIAEETRQSLSVTEEATGAQYRFVLPGPSLTPGEEAALARLPDTLDPAPRWLVLSGSLPRGISESFVPEVAAAARRIGARLVVDGPAGLIGRCDGAFVVKPNLAALEALAGQALPSPADQVAAARALIAEGRSEAVLVSLGADGALLVTWDEAWALGSPAVPLRSAVGAGDSMVGALVLALSRGLSLPEAAAEGAAAGAATIMTPDTELCHPEDVRRLRAEVTIRRHDGAAAAPSRGAAG